MEDKTCWICFLTSSDDSSMDRSSSKWIHPCKCKGSTRWVHETCLLKWLRSNSDTGTNLFRYGVRRSSDTISIYPPSSITTMNSSVEEEEMPISNTILRKSFDLIKRIMRRIWPGVSGQVVTISSKISCPQCKTPYILVQKENSLILSFLEKINYAGSKTLTMFVYSSLVIGGLSVLWVHGTFSLLFMYGIEDYTNLFSEILLNEETLSEENVLTTLAAAMNYFSFTLVAVPMIPLFLIASVLPITSFRHALSIILMGRLYLFNANIDPTGTTNLEHDEFQPIVWILPAMYVAYSITRNYLFKKLGISKKIAERQLAATSDILAAEGEDESTIMAAVIIDSGSSDESDENEDSPGTNQERELDANVQGNTPPRESPISSTVRTIATIRSSITPIISALFMPFLTPFARILISSIFGRFFPVSSFPVIYKNLATASILILVKDIFQITYHVERDHLEKSRSVLNYNLPESISE